MAHNLDGVLQDIKNKKQADIEGIARNNDHIQAIKNTNIFLAHRVVSYGKAIKVLEAVIEGKDRVCI